MIQCHPFVDPADYVRMCTDEICLEEDHKDLLCEIAEEYASRCLAKGICLEFRRAMNCSLPTCAENSHYEECGNGCETTCDAVACGDEAGPTCTCDENMVIDRKYGQFYVTSNARMDGFFVQKFNSCFNCKRNDYDL